MIFNSTECIDCKDTAKVGVKHQLINQSIIVKILPPFCIILRYLLFVLQPGQIIDIRAMINDATKMSAEEGVDGQVWIYLFFLELFVDILPMYKIV